MRVSNVFASDEKYRRNNFGVQSLLRFEPKSRNPIVVSPSTVSHPGPPVVLSPLGTVERRRTRVSPKHDWSAAFGRSSIEVYLTIAGVPSNFMRYLMGQSLPQKPEVTLAM
jgi:hypothetical protein